MPDLQAAACRHDSGRLDNLPLLTLRHSPASVDSYLGDVLQLAVQLLRHGAQILTADGEGRRAIHAMTHHRLTQHALGILDEIGVHPCGVLLSVIAYGDGARFQPPRVQRFLTWEPLTEDQDVSEGIGAGGAAVRPSWQPDGT